MAIGYHVHLIALMTCLFASLVVEIENTPDSIGVDFDCLRGYNVSVGVNMIGIVCRVCVRFFFLLQLVVFVMRW